MAEEAPANVNVTSALPDDIREAVAATNFKVLSEAQVVQQNLATANSVAHANRMSLLAEASTALALGKILNTSPTEGGTDIAALMQLVKAAQSTPPVTVPPPAGG